MIEMRHRIRGRVRWRISTLYRNPDLGERLEDALKGVEGINLVRSRTVCASLVVRYDPGKLSAETLYGIIAPLAGKNPAASHKKESIECVGCRREVRPETKRSWFRRIGSFALLSGYLGYVLVREYIQKAPVSQSALSPTGIVSVAAAYPLLKDAWHETFEERRFAVNQFLSVALLLGIFMGEVLTAFEIIYVLRGAKLLEEYAAERSRGAIRKMLQLAVRDALLLVDGTEVQVAIEALRPEDLVVVRTGGKIPIDGTIETGEALLNEALITGKSEPAYKNAGDKVFAGSYVDKGKLTVRARKVGGQTYLARIAALVEASLDQKAPLEQRADELAARLLRMGTGLTLLTLLATRSVTRAFTVMLVMSCPCATVLAASTAVSAAIRNAARRRILVKGGVYLEQVGEADTYCFDKTGTITTEETEIAGMVSEDEAELLYLAACAELHNPHALASAILARADALGIEPKPPDMSEHILGQGVKASIDGRDILLGNRKMMLGAGIDVAPYIGDARRMIDQGQTAVYVARDGRLLGVMGVSHRLRPGTQSTLERLRASGVRRIVLISGDERPVVEALSRQLGMDACHAGLLPEDKARLVNELRRESGTLVMIGDGVNDAPALSEADIGIAMGAGGSEVAIEVADIALADSNVRNLVYVRGLSRATRRVAEQNHWLAIGTDLAGAALGAMGWLSPATGGLIHIAHTLGILLNSSRLLAFDEADGDSDTTAV
ncbi:MAG: cation-translocating P-type ATPase [Pseudomonadota bacterium]|nr:cation-translocating P-type ATPase [Pseudomonadota bacterium]